MVVLLALFACTSGTSSDATVTPPPPLDPPVAPPREIPRILLADAEPAAMPAGEAIVRDCWPEPVAAKPMPRPRPTPMPTKQPTTKTMTRPSSRAPMDFATAEPSADSAPAMAPSAPPMAEVASAPVTVVGAKGIGSGGATTTTTGATRSEEAKPRGPQADPADQNSVRAQRDKDAPKLDDAKVAAKEWEERPVEKAKKVEQTFDWGGTTWLSNDDSMSLASAQHLLHSVKEGDSFRAADVRPHELLNYFSFDTVPPAEGELFSINASAEKTAGETMTMAFAVKGALPPRRPLDLTYVIDRSGSMHAEGRMEYVKRALLLGTESFAPGDRIDIVLFDDKVCTPLENYVVGRDDPKLLEKTIARLAPEGGTNIGIGLKEAYKIVEDPSRDQGVKRNRRVMLLTDAQVNQGEIDADALAKVASGYDKLGVRLTGVGVGKGFRDDILDTVTEKGHGAYVYLGSEGVVDRLFGPGFRSMTETIAHDVKFELDLPPSLAMERFYGEESSTNAEDIDPIHYYAGTTQLFLQDLKVDPSKLAPTDELKLTVHYRDAFTDEPGTQVLTWGVGDLMKSDRRNLDKARALMGWSDLLLAEAMGGDPCGAPLLTWRERAGKVSDDLEIAYVHGLVGKTCRGVAPLPDAPEGALAGVAYKVRVDSDVPIAEVELACGSKNLKERLSGSDTIARFSVTPGACTVTLQGNVPMTAKVDVPEAGGDVKCMVRGGRMSCG